MRLLLSGARRYMAQAAHIPPSADPKLVYVEKLSDPHAGVAYLTMNRPEARNALSKKMVSQLESCIQFLKAEKWIRVVVMRSVVPGVFCAGADLKERKSMSESEVEPFVERLRILATSLEELPMPTIAALDGAALGGGLEIALACDVRVAAPDARLGLVETKLAIIPGAGGTQRLPRVIGPVLAKELILTARTLNGTEAKEMGLVNRVSKPGKSAESLALEVASEMLPNGPLALRMAKLAINKGMQVSLHDGLEYEKSYYAQIIKTKDRIEGLAAFGEKRPPIYKGE